MAFNTLSTAILAKEKCFAEVTTYRITKVTLNSFYNIEVLWPPEKCFSRNVMYIPLISDSSP